MLNIGVRLRAKRPPRPEALRLRLIRSNIIRQQNMVTSLATLPRETVGEVPAIHFAWQLPAHQAGDARKQVHGDALVLLVCISGDARVSGVEDVI
jgi:hypothetical protein